MLRFILTISIKKLFVLMYYFVAFLPNGIKQINSLLLVYVGALIKTLLRDVLAYNICNKHFLEHWK